MPSHKMPILSPSAFPYSRSNVCLVLNWFGGNCETNKLRIKDLTNIIERPIG